MFHLMAFEAALGVNAANTDVPQLSDQEFSARNSHTFLQDPLRLLLAEYNAASATDARLDAPSINQVARHHIFPVFRSATIPDDPRLQDFRSQQVILPAGEEIALQGSNNLGAATEASYGFMWLTQPAWRPSIPSGQQRLTARASYAITSVANAWTGLGALTFAENLRGGTYAVVGFQVFDANVLAARLVFGRRPSYNGKSFRPGCLGLQALGNRPWPDFMGGMGEWGRFLSYELPQVEILASDAAAHTGVAFFDLVYLGPSSMI